MSLFSWFSRKPSPSKPRSPIEPSGLLNADATVPLAVGRNPALEPRPVEHAANRKNERMERRELLYTVVRDAMVRAGVLSASYKFKVLSLDQRGRQFLVMMDLAREFGGETVRLSEIEALIAQTAKARYDIAVNAVYWRLNDHVAVGMPQKAPVPRPQAAPAAAAASGAPAPRAAATPPPPTWNADRMNPVRRRRLLFVLLALLVAGAATALIAMALQRNVAYLYTPAEVLRGDASERARFRLGGMVEKGSFTRENGSLVSHFRVTDGDAQLTVRYDKILPDLFREGQAVVATGAMQDGVFVAEDVLAKHDETYMPKEVADKMGMAHQKHDVQVPATAAEPAP